MSSHKKPNKNDVNSIHFFKVLLHNTFQEEFMLPKNFVRKHWKKLSNPVLLKLPNNKQCEVHWIKRDGNIWLTEGWKTFAHISCLKYQYLLLFKYEEGDSSFEVTVYDKSASGIDYSSNEDTAKDCEVGNHVSLVNFFKVLIHRNFEEELSLPRSFVREHWKGISNPILLKLPNNTECKVHWIESDDDKIWLKEGWKRFGHMCCLRQEYFLFFEYKEGGSCFEVVICDKSGLEIDYPSSRYDDEKNTQDCEVIEIVDQTEINVEHSNRNKTNTGAAGRRSSGKISTNSETILKKKAKAFQSKLQNPSFIREMTRTYVTHNFVRIPNWFTREHLRGLEGATTIVCGDMICPVQFGFCNSNDDRATISSGWKLFQRFELKAYDICVFEKTEMTPLSFKIEIIRAREGQSSIQKLEEADEQNHYKPKRSGARYTERDNGQIRKRKIDDGVSGRLRGRSGSVCMNVNQFKIQIQKSHLQSIVYIPAAFRDRHTKFLGEEVNFQVGEISWPVKLLHRGAFSEGWPAFAIGCKLVVGDVCMFTITDEERMVFQVSISGQHP